MTKRPRVLGESAPAGLEGAISAARYTRHRRVDAAVRHVRPRVVQVLATGSTGGAQESFTGLLLHLDRRRYDVRAVSLSAGTAVQRLRRLGVRVDVIEAPDDDAAVAELAAYLRRAEIDLLHAHMFRAEVIGTRAAVRAGTPVVVATVHSSRVRSGEDMATLAELTRHMDRLIVPSSSIEAKVRREGRLARFSVVPNGVDASRFSGPLPPCGIREELGIPRHALLVGVLARLEPEKGHRYLIQAMPDVVRAVPSAWLVIVGDGSLLDDLRRQAAALPDPARRRICFTGRRDDVSALTAELDVAILPSLREAQGISLLEAMARRRPVVASRVGGIPEVVTDGVDGILVPPRNPTALAAALTHLLRDPELRTALGERGYRTVVERFSIEAQVRRTEAIYDEELARAGVPVALRPPPSAEAASDRPPAGRAALEVPPVDL